MILWRSILIFLITNTMIYIYIFICGSKYNKNLPVVLNRYIIFIQTSASGCIARGNCLENDLVHGIRVSESVLLFFSKDLLRRFSLNPMSALRMTFRYATLRLKAVRNRSLHQRNSDPFDSATTLFSFPLISAYNWSLRRKGLLPARVGVFSVVTWDILIGIGGKSHWICFFMNEDYHGSLFS